MQIKPYVTERGGVVILNGPFPKEEAERIAKLCEAAPGLLAVLKSVADHMEEESERLKCCDDLLHIARAIIAKAEPA